MSRYFIVIVFPVYINKILGKTGQRKLHLANMTTCKFFFGTFVLVLISSPFKLIEAEDLPTNYEYYTSGGIKTGLSADQKYFLLNEKNITIFSGAFHYFRVHNSQWRDRLQKLRAAGLNTVETYVAWNLHEYHSGM